MAIDRFYGRITGVGTTNGIRFVVGHWTRTPQGPFADVMVEEPGGHRILLAPDSTVAAVITGLYTFDEVRLGPVQAELTSDRLSVSAPGLTLEVSLGRRTPLGCLLRLVPRRLMAMPWWCRAIDPVARLTMNGVRTAGESRRGRREFYGAVDARTVVGLTGTWQGRPLGELAAVDPPVTFGFGSTPRSPTMTTVVTTAVTRD